MRLKGVLDKEKGIRERDVQGQGLTPTSWRSKVGREKEEVKESFMNQ